MGIVKLTQNLKIFKKMALRILGLSKGRISADPVNLTTPIGAMKFQVFSNKKFINLRIGY